MDFGRSRLLRQVFAQAAKHWLTRIDSGQAAAGRAVSQGQRRAYNALREELPSSPAEQVSPFVRPMHPRHARHHLNLPLAASSPRLPTALSSAGGLSTQPQQAWRRRRGDTSV